MKKLMLVILCLIVYNAGLFAQRSSSDDPLVRAFFSPELLMQSQQAINFREAQRNSLNKEMQSAQSEFMPLQWDLQKEMEKFKSLIEKESPNEDEVSEQLERMMIIENKIKKRQVIFMVKIKNLLTHEQQEKLQKLKK